MPYGRGGAGNIQAVEQESARVAADLEANQQSAETYSKGDSISESTARNEQKYALSGRGGAGNWYSPAELSQKGHFSNTTAGSGEAARGDPSGQPPTDVPKVGRGGAGNIFFGMSDEAEKSAQKSAEGAKTQEELKRQIEEGVKEQLAMPERAKLAGSERRYAS